VTIAPVTQPLTHARKAAAPKERQAPQEPTYSVEMIGPSEAVAYLGRNTDRNRRLRPHLAAVYAKDMTEGNWRLSNDAICFDRNDILINGQHRLKAVVLSGTRQQFFVIRGMDPLAFEYIDIGPSRTVADVLTIKGQKNANAVAAITAKAAGYTKAGYLNSSIARSGLNGTVGGPLHVSRKDKIHVTEVLSEIHYGAELGKRLSKAGQRLGLAPAQIGFLYVLYQSWHTGIEDFIERAVNLRGDARGDSDPARRVGLRLVDAQSSTDVDKLSPAVQFGYLVIAANADFQQRSLGKLQWRRRNLYPQPVVQVASALATRLGWPTPKGMAEEPEEPGA
jgi:hypothetical protein